MDSPQTSYIANSSIQGSIDDINLLSFNRDISDLSSKIGSIILSTKDLHHPDTHDDDEEETTQSASINDPNNGMKMLKRNKGYKKLYNVPKRIRKAAKQLANILAVRPSTAK
jgi:hypothetical protein